MLRYGVVGLMSSRRSWVRSSSLLRDDVTLHVGKIRHVSNMSERSTRIHEVVSTSASQLIASFPSVVGGVARSRRYQHLPLVNDWIKKLLEGTVPLGSNTMAMNTLVSYHLLAAPDQLSEEHLRKACLMSWCAEINLAFLILVDDMMDKAETRRGEPCWYRRPDVGSAAVNDCFLLEGAAYHLLRENFREELYYQQVVDTFLEVTYKTYMGQSLDVLAGRDLDLMTPELHVHLLRYKNTFILTHLPVLLAMHMTGVNDPQTIESVTKVLDFASFIQIENDYLDCYGDYEALGKEGVAVDINNGSPSWLIVAALQRVSQRQREVLQRWYGSPDPEAVLHVKKVYDDLGLQEVFECYKKESYHQAREDIARLENWRLQDVLLALLKGIYHKGSHWVI